MQATIDIGTNSVRLFVAEQKSLGYKTVLTQVIVTRLGQDVDQTGILSQPAIERTLAALCKYQAVLQDYQVDKIMVVATSAVRDAQNRSDFLAQVVTKTGWHVQVLSGAQEAQASFAGAVQALKDTGCTLNQHVVVVDIGGGSTELIYGLADGTIIFGDSAQVGGVRMTESCLDMPAMTQVITTRLSALVNSWQIKAPFTLVGVGGTITTLAALEQRLAKYDRNLITGFTLHKEQVVGWLEQLTEMGLAQRSLLPGMTPGREDIIVAGIVICQKVMDITGKDKLLVSDGDLLQGISQISVDNR